jgi:MFS superfamily sulfate permease-like transporter
MHNTEGGRTGAAWVPETLAGFSGALAALPVALTVGTLAFWPLGAAAPHAALVAAFAAASVGSLAHALISRTRMPGAGPSSATALTMADLVAQLLTDPRLAPAHAGGLQSLIGLCAVAVVLSGLLQVAFGMLGWARLTSVVPQPVLAGFMNGTALLIALAQLPLLLGLPLGSALTLDALQQAHGPAMALGLTTAGAIWLCRHRWPRLPGSLLALVAGAAVYALLAAQGRGVDLGGTVGAIPPAWPWQPALSVLWPLWRAPGVDLLQAHAAQIGLTALALAAIGGLESSLNARAMDQLLDARHDPDRELIALGCGNLISSVFGGVPLVLTRVRAMATLQAGGRTRVAALAGAVAVGLLFLLGGPVLAALPLAALAGMMLTVAWGLADRWSGRLIQRFWAGDRSRDLLLGLGVMVLVVATMLGRGVLAGIGLGVLLSLLTFAVRMNRSLVHDRYTAAQRPSRRSYPAAVEARLRPLRGHIMVFELDGALFFGSAEKLLDEADALGADCGSLVLDLRRVGAIDESGALALQQTVLRAGQRGITVKLAGLADGSAAARALRSLAPNLPHWPDADRAIEAAEHRLLGGDDVRAMAEVPLAQSALLAGLDAEQVATVTAQMQPRQLAAGEALFAEGDPGDRLYVVGSGSVSILSAPDHLGRTQRYLSVSPGMMLGETAMLDGGGRTASAVADAPTAIHALTQRALDEIGRSHPDIAIRLHRNVALHLSQRLRGAAGAWRASAR